MAPEMAPPNAVVSPDGAYFWDGQGWRPVTAPQTPPAAQPQADRPSWLPAETPPPSAMAPAVVPPVAEQPSASAYFPPTAAEAPLWQSPAPPKSDSRTMLMLAAGVILVLLVGVAGYSAYQLNQQNSGAVTAVSHLASPSPLASPTAPASVAPALPLTAQLGGSYCPVAHLNNTACWRGNVVDTGPRIGKLALIFVTGGGYTNWFTTHSNPALSGFYTTAGCDLDVPNGRMVCGSVQQGEEVTVYLMGDTTKRGTFHYAVKFADISSGSPVYIDQLANGTHQVVSWYEKIT